MPVHFVVAVVTITNSLFNSLYLVGDSFLVAVTLTRRRRRRRRRIGRRKRRRRRRRQALWNCPHWRISNQHWGGVQRSAWEIN
jgi:hypothetical protein